MRRNWSTRIFAGVVITVGLFASGASAQNAPDANAILEQSIKYSQSLNSFYADCLTTLTMAQGTKPMRSQIWAQMPDKLVMRMDSGDAGANLMYLNGNKQAIYFPGKNSYVTAEVAPDGIKQNLQQLTSGGIGGGWIRHRPAERDAGGVCGQGNDYRHSHEPYPPDSAHWRKRRYVDR